jgi:putative membrane protein
MKDTGDGGSSWRYEFVLLQAFAVALIASSIHAYDGFTWFLEVVPALIGVAVLAATRYRFRFTPLVYTLILIHCIILMVGGHYTYARVPVGDWVSNALHLGRNHYDRLGHFAQGFVPAMIAREFFLRRGIVRRGGWLIFLTIAMCMGISACYELFEYGVAVASGSGADNFLGGQGDPWDTQNDMLLCLVGSCTAMLTMRGVQDRAIRKLESRSARAMQQA